MEKQSPEQQEREQPVPRGRGLTNLAGGEAGPGSGTGSDVPLQLGSEILR